jgi:HK97 family phage major capsid protein
MKAKTLGDLYVQELAAKGLTVLETKTHPFQTSEFKAATDTQVVGGPDGAYGPYVTDIDQQGVWGTEYALTVASLFSAGSISGNSIKYPVYGSLEGGAKTVKEGAQKPQLHLPDPTWIVDSLTEVAAYWKISDDMAEDYPYVVSEIQQHASYNLQLQEELQLLSGAGANADLKGVLNRGIQTIAKGADADPDRIFHATTLINTATGFPADAIVINPADYEALRLSKDGNQQYYGGGFFSGQYGQGGVLQNPALWGLRTVVTPSITSGTVLVGAFKAGGMVFRKGGLRVESTNSNENDFTNDKVTFRVKERLGLQVKYPQAFVSVALGLKVGA